MQCELIYNDANHKENPMTIILRLISALVLLSLSLNAAPFSKSDPNGTIIQEGSSKAWCSVCGMNLRMFYKTNHALVLSDGTKKQYCSLHCLAHDHEAHKSTVKSIHAVDAKTHKLIDATTAHYVIGSKAPGTMSMVSKYAFADLVDAKAFQKNHQGKEIMGYKKAFTLAQSGLEKDATMLETKKKNTVYPKGKMMHQKLCKGADLHAHDYDTIADFKAAIAAAKPCGTLKEPELQMLSVYLWDHRKGDKPHARKAKKAGLGEAIVVPKEAKCPVCGMFVFKYPRWAAKMVMSDGGEHYFDGAKDMFKFHLQQQKSSAGAGLILVTDYYTQSALQAKSAVYVIGSDVYGPMGNELIPFSTIQDARTFAKDHSGTRILTFDEVTMPLLESLDE
jgi:nitrous oxide reductase accessory protein NosL